MGRRSLSSSPRRILPDEAVDRLADQVGVANVPRVLLNHVEDQPAHVGVVAVVVSDLGVTAETAGGNGLVDQPLPLRDRVVEELLQRRGGVDVLNPPVPALVVPVGGVERSERRARAV